MSITNIFLQKSLFQNKCVIVCITFDLLIKRFDLGSRLVVCVVRVILFGLKLLGFCNHYWFWCIAFAFAFVFCFAVLCVVWMDE